MKKFKTTIILVLFFGAMLGCMFYAHDVKSTQMKVDMGGYPLPSEGSVYSIEDPGRKFTAVGERAITDLMQSAVRNSVGLMQVYANWNYQEEVVDIGNIYMTMELSDNLNWEEYYKTRKGWLVNLQDVEELVDYSVENCTINSKYNSARVLIKYHTKLLNGSLEKKYMKKCFPDGIGSISKDKYIDLYLRAEENYNNLGNIEYLIHDFKITHWT